MKTAGRHVILDGFVQSPEVFSDKNLDEMFKKLVSVLDMEIIYGPKFIEVQLDPQKLKSETFSDEGGISGFMMISTSHVSIHCWPLRKFFSMDCFSCKDYDVRKAVGVIKEYLGVERVNILNVERTQPM